MKNVSYLNFILTINALLLVAVLIVLASGSSLGPAEASAQAGLGAVSGVPNAGAQRQRMIDSLARIESSVTTLHRSIDAGRMRVEVTNLGDIQIKSSN